MRIYTYALDGTVMYSTRPADYTWVCLCAPEIGHRDLGHLTGQMILLACPLPVLCVRVNFSAAFLAGGHIDGPMPLPFRFFSRLFITRLVNLQQKRRWPTTSSSFRRPCIAMLQCTPAFTWTHHHRCIRLELKLTLVTSKELFALQAWRLSCLSVYHFYG